MENNSMNLSSLNILVIGDIMLDRYQVGDSTKLSPEAPVPVVLIDQYFDRLGGAANVALNIQSLGVSASLCSLYAEDSAGLRISELLASNNITSYLMPLHSTTTTKTRILSRAHHLLRIDNEAPVTSDIASTFSSLPILPELIESSDLVLLSDYNKGCLHYVEKIISICT
ncbi:PfkB family carbohydrate kinase, partial [bacterium]|nr:PfkB family carbohydrate kinase [bacterium]